MDLKKLSLEQLQETLTKVNADRDALSSTARAITAEIADRTATAAAKEQLSRMTPEARAALKQAL